MLYTVFLHSHSFCSCALLVFINTIFREPQSNYSFFTTYQMFMRTYYFNRRTLMIQKVVYL